MEEFSLKDLKCVEKILDKYDDAIRNLNSTQMTAFKKEFFNTTEMIKNRLIKIEEDFRKKLTGIDTNINSSRDNISIVTPSEDTPSGPLRRKQLNLNRKPVSNVVKEVNEDSKSQIISNVVENEELQEIPSTTPTPGDTPNVILSKKSIKEFDEAKIKQILISIYYDLLEILEDQKDFIFLKVKDMKNERFLIKLFKNSETSSFLNEIESHKRLQNCRYTLRMKKNGNVHGKYDFIVYDDADFRVFRQILNEKNRNSGIKESQLFFFFIQIYFGICEMHYNGVLKNELNIEDILYDGMTGQLFIYKFNTIIVDENGHDIDRLIKKDLFNMGKVLVEMILLVGGIYYREEDDLLSLVSGLMPFISSELKFVFFNLVDSECKIDLVSLQKTDWFRINKNMLNSLPASNLNELLNLL